MPPSDQEIAETYAPIIRQEINDEAPHKDFILRYDFERPEDAEERPDYWKWRDPNKKRLIELLDESGTSPCTEHPGCATAGDAADPRHLDLRGYVYYSVVRTRTHYFVCYVFYHPVDWKSGFGHSNNLEGAMVVADCESGRLVIASALAHNWIASGRVDQYGRPLNRDPAQRFTVYLWGGDPAKRRATFHIETKGHGALLNGFTRRNAPGWDGTLEYRPLSAPENGGHEAPPWGDQTGGAYHDRGSWIARAYQLVPILREGGEFSLWNQFKDVAPESSGMSAPWFWTGGAGPFTGGDVGGDLGEWFLDPAFYYAYRRGLGRRWGDLRVRDDVNAGAWALRYAWNPFLKYKRSHQAAWPFEPERDTPLLKRIIKRRYRRRGEYFEPEHE
jgi:hypothetical protein